MERLYLDLQEKSYEILFSEDFSGLCGALADIDAPKKLLIVTDSNVKPLYATEVEELLTAGGYDVKTFAFPAGEAQKHMQTILDICAACVEHKMDRKSMIVALGGGVVGDMAGFAAAIYLRGIPFVQIPTTLLSQSDSSVGGKTGIDFCEGKNILGAFHQPKLVYINVSTLKTLPQREFVSGMGEVIKHGVIRDGAFFRELAENHDKIAALAPADLITMTKKNCAIKADVVSKDERELGLRADLNFGHTIGHAVESYLQFSWSHGECVGVGMLAAANIAQKRGIFTQEDYQKLFDILTLYGFRTSVEIKNAKEVLALLGKDKKRIAGKQKFVLPTAIGTVVQVMDVTEEEILSGISAITAGKESK